MRLVPRGVERRLRPIVRRVEGFLRDWEWTWTKAFIVAMLISGIAMSTLVVIPSWMLYFVEAHFDTKSRLIITARDLVVNGFIFTNTGILILVFYFAQKIRRRVRGESQSERYSGGYR
ncbi:MAG TPA: hypothetical protein VEA19_01060 [Actinomycetota bacterium]|nr:hypothetical protein [Actinomycetota bacterium]